MTRKFKELRDPVIADPERRARVEQFRRAMEDAVRLAELRERRGTSQQELSASAGISQGRVSQIEHADDLYLSTLNDYVAGLGGHLQIAAVFDDEVIIIQMLGSSC